MRVRSSVGDEVEEGADDGGGGRVAVDEGGKRGDAVVGRVWMVGGGDWVELVCEGDLKQADGSEWDCLCVCVCVEREGERV